MKIKLIKLIMKLERFLMNLSKMMNLLWNHNFSFYLMKKRNMFLMAINYQIKRNICKLKWKNVKMKIFKIQPEN